MCLNLYKQDTVLKKPVRAWRAFSIGARGYLHAICYSHRYTRCNIDRRGRGFYVYRSIGGLQKGQGRWSSAYAEVRISGEALVYTNGWVAKKLRIVRIYVQRPQGYDATRLRRIYRVPVVSTKKLWK